MTEAGSIDLDAVEVIIPNLKKRYSGGTAVNRTIAPLIAERCNAVWFGPDRPDGIAGLSLMDLLRLRSRPPSGRPARIWHARRNTEMQLGLALKLFGWPLKLIFNSAGQRRKTFYTNFLIRRMDAVIATSAVSASFVERPATVIHHGIDLDAYKPPADGAAAFAGAGLPGKYGIGTFGRVRKQKGSDLFVEAMCRLLPKYPDFTAVIVGHVSVDNLAFAEKLKSRIAAAGLTERIRFLGERPIEEVPLWFQRISIYVFASRVEGFGLTMLEAMAAGDAVIATRAGAAEMLIDDGETGFLAPIDDVEALTAAIEPMMREPEKIPAIGAKARARVVRDFSRDREADEIVAVYQRLWGDATAAGGVQSSPVTAP
jgi:mannosyltransferase